MSKVPRYCLQTLRGGSKTGLGQTHGTSLLRPSLSHTLSVSFPPALSRSFVISFTPSPSLSLPHLPSPSLARTHKHTHALRPSLRLSLSPSSISCSLALSLSRCVGVGEHATDSHGGPASSGVAPLLSKNLHPRADVGVEQGGVWE